MKMIAWEIVILDVVFILFCGFGHLFSPADMAEYAGKISIYVMAFSDYTSFKHPQL